MAQLPDENPQEFLMQALNVRQRILINPEDEITYNPVLVQGIFLRTLETGLGEENIRTKMRPLLQSTSVDDAELMETMKQIVSSEQEHQQKFVEISKSRPVKVQAVEEKSCSKPEHAKKTKRG